VTNLTRRCRGPIIRAACDGVLIAPGLILAIAPVGAAEYLTAGADPQRTGWVKEEKVGFAMERD